MVTLAKLCLVLGLAFASPRPTWSRNQDTGDKVFKVGVSVRIPNALSSSGDLENEGEKPGFSPSVPELSCPEKDYIVFGHVIKTEEGIESWNECGKLCLMLADTCEYWTWEQADPQRCYLKSDYNGGTYYDPGPLGIFREFSGKRGCE